MTEVCTRCGDWYREGDVHMCWKAETSSEPPPSKVISLVERRPPVTDNRTWTAEAMLLALLEEVRSGKTRPENMMVFFMTLEPNGSYRPQTWLQNISVAEEIAYHHLGITKAIERWRSG